MATTDTGFNFKFNLAGRTSGVHITKVIASSQTIAVGDAVLANSSGFVSVATAGNPIIGFVVALVDVNGIDMDNSRVVKDGTYSSTAKSYVAASDNQTNKQFSAQIDIDPMSVWSAQPDGTIGTTSSSGKSSLWGSYTDIISAGQPDENNNGNAFNVKAQLFIHGLDPENTARGLYSIAEHQIWGA